MTEQTPPAEVRGESSAPNWLLVRYRRIHEQLSWFQKELEQDRALLHAGDTNRGAIEAALCLHSRARALLGLSDTFTSFAFNVPMGDFSEADWQKVYADPNLVDGTAEFFSKMEEQCNLYVEATIGVHRQFASMSMPPEHG